MISSELLGSSGPFAQVFPGFAVRDQQLVMSDAVENALESAEHLIVEAGTGTGKTLAYIVPAIISGKKIIISTGTRNLQDQLFNKDLPAVADVLGRSLNATLLKGRSNYICPQRLQVYAESGPDITHHLLEDLVKIQQWWPRSSTGDIAEVAGVSEGSAIWPRITSTVDNCLGRSCPKYDNCPLYQARASAYKADIIVVNHHLLFADLVLKDQGGGELLPDVDAIIVDEAHQVPDIASAFFGLSLSSRQLLELCRDVLAEQLQVGADDPRLETLVRVLRKTVSSLTVELGAINTGKSWAELLSVANVAEAIILLRQNLEDLQALLVVVGERSRGLENCSQRTDRYCDRFNLLTQAVGWDEESVHWVDASAWGFVINLSPLDVSGHFSRLMSGMDTTWVFTSATLSVAESFEHFQIQLGLDPATRSIRLDSPYEFAKKVMLYVPGKLPDPTHPNYTAQLVDQVKPLIKANKGGTFFLFTSHRALAEAAGKLARETDFNCLVQGSMPKTELLARFRGKRSVLLGTNSFWEGVDVKGDQLTCVIIDKLPFLSPGDPVVKARLEYLAKNDVNGFFSYQLPEAVLSLKQGFGRLIRDADDWGLFVLGDPRVLEKSYGRFFLRSLPPIPLTRSETEAIDFLTDPPRVAS
jgi:ATP-dependent DNA helicase DinG